MEDLQAWFQSGISGLVDDPRSIGLVLLILAATVAVYYRQFMSKTSSPSSTADLLQSKNSSNKPSTSSKFTPTPVENDVWEERKKRGILPASMNKKGAEGDKPFGSSYYYAHNNTNAKGGYSDGLRMEDYTMNGPRLLSVSGKPVEATANDDTISANNKAREDETTSETNVFPEQAPETTTSSVSSQPAAPTASKPIQYKDITKYLWDDPGDSSGIGTIWIDTLPGTETTTTTTTISWKDAKIKTVEATLLKDDGLLVLATAEDDQIYRLKISRLFDKATKVRSVVKPKRLLVKIHKERNTINFLGKSNLEAWPHPQRKHKL